jgi:hypothetical protein
LKKTVLCITQKWAARVGSGSWLCKNSEMGNRDRITISSKLSFNARKFVGVLKVGRSEETILLCFQFLAFLHNQGHSRTEVA